MSGVSGINAYAVLPRLVSPLAAFAAILGCLWLLITRAMGKGADAAMLAGPLSTVLANKPIMVINAALSMTAMCTRPVVSTSRHRHGLT